MTNKKKTSKIYNKKEFKSNDGMLTTIWGPSLWHTLHVISFNYPINPTKDDKKSYKQYIYLLKKTLPCGICRKNLIKNLKDLPLKGKDLKNRESFSRWVFNLHELVNKMLNKQSGLTYNDVRERYEHFRARCTIDMTSILKKKSRKNKKEKGCTKPLYGKKAKCLIRIVPDESNEKTLEIDRECLKKR